MILVLAGLVLWSGCFQNLRPQLGQGCDADASENTCGDGYQCVFIDSLQDGRCVPQSQDAQDINEAFSEALDGTSDGKETADAGGADGSGEGQSDGTPVADAGSADGSGEGQSDGTPVADAGSADGSGEGQSDGTPVADAGSADGTGEGQSDGTPVADAGSADGAGDGAEAPDAGVGCPACAADEVCDPDTNTCVDCLSNSECSNANVCDTETKTCVGCLSNDNCPANQVCNTTEQACVNCFDSMHCGDNETCNMNSFVCECTDGYDDLEDGMGCQDVNECEEEEPCFDDQENPPTCINTIGGYECRSCDNGYVVPDSGIGACEPALSQATPTVQRRARPSLAHASQAIPATCSGTQARHNGAAVALRRPTLQTPNACPQTPVERSVAFALRAILVLSPGTRTPRRGTALVTSQQ